MKIYFDLDDTLYRQFDPFLKAYQQLFHNDIDIYQFWLTSRKYNNEIYELFLKKEITKNELVIYRLQRAFQDFAIDITDQQALDFQDLYFENQQKITLSQTMKKILDFLYAKHIELGVITNGPINAQTKKIEALGLTKWIDKQHIFISSQVGLIKPDHRIFDLARENEKDCLFVGDGYDIDIVGAKKAGWKTIWFNHKKEIFNDCIADKTVYSEEELMNVLKNSNI